MTAQIELMPLQCSPKPWMKKLITVGLEKIELDAFIDEIIQHCNMAAKKLKTDFQTALTSVYLPFPSSDYNKFNPSDALLHRLKYLCEVSDSQVAKTLYAGMLQERALHLIVVEQKKELSLDQILADEELAKLYRSVCDDVDIYYYNTVHNNMSKTKYIRNVRMLSKKLKEFLRLFKEDQNNLAASFHTMIRLGEFLKQIFPHSSSEEISRHVRLFSIELKYNGITEGTSITMANYVLKNIPSYRKMANPELNEFYIKKNIPYSAKVDDFRLGMFAMHWLLDFKKLRQDTQHNNSLIAKSTDIFTNDLLPYSARRVELDAVISEIEKYANSKFKDDEKKYYAASELANELRRNSLKFFGDHPKTFGMSEKFHQKCLKAISKAKIVLAKHRDPYWDRLMFKLGVVLATIFTGGLALFWSEKCWATLFYNETNGMRLLNKATEALSTPISPVVS